MDRGTGVHVDAAAGQDAWDWEVLQPDTMSSSRMSHDDGTNLDDDQEAKELVTTPPSSDGDAHDEPPPDECKDIGVVPDETTTEPSKAAVEEEEAMPEVTGDLSSASAEDEEEEEKTTLQSFDDDTDKKPADTQADDDDEKEKEEEEEGDDAIKRQDNGGGSARPAPADCVVFSVGKLKVNGIGALCSFGVAAATVCIFLIGGRMQHRQQNKIQLQFYGDDDKRIQQVMQQTSRLNQTMSSVMGGGSGSGSTRANISFGGYYDGL